MAILLLAILFVSTVTSTRAIAGPADDILPIWREVFARPDTSLAKIPAPNSNPLTRAKIQLGEKLFNDTRLSGNRTRSCATCHDSNHAFTDGRRQAAPLDGKTKLANTPPLLNLAWAKRLFWDGRAKSLEEQVRFPIEHSQEMASSWDKIAKRLTSDSTLEELFRGAFPTASIPSRENISSAIASYERSLITPPSRFDKFVGGDIDALTQKEIAGFKLFVGKAGCVPCHSGWRLTDDRLHHTGRSRDAVKTPTLRGLALTAPYMHNGSLASISEVLAHYTALSPNNRSLSTNLTRPLSLTSEEKIALIAFLISIE